MIVTIDGPAGAGKSSVARALAQRLGFAFLDTGAMYRTVALAALRQDLGWDNPAALAALARRSNIEVREDGTFLDGQDVSQEIRSHEVTTATHYAANNPAVRVHLVELQRQAAGRLDIVTEGRDQGTVVFPQAECKIFLDASPEERARRRQADLAARGEKLSLEEVWPIKTVATKVTRLARSDRWSLPKMPFTSAATGCRPTRLSSAWKHWSAPASRKPRSNGDPVKQVPTFGIIAHMADRSLANDLWYRYLHVTCRMTFAGLFHLRCTGRDNEPATGGALVLSNHQSMFDPVLVGATLDRRLNYMARETLFAHAPFRWLIQSLDAIPIDRDGLAFRD